MIVFEQGTAIVFVEPWNAETKNVSINLRSASA